MIESSLLDPISGYINGQWVDADSGAPLPPHRPRWHECLMPKHIVNG